jgi:hypothetical protein
MDLTDESTTTTGGGAGAEEATHTEQLGVPNKNGEGTVIEEFALFPKIPIELRLKTWKLSLPGGSLLPFTYFASFLLCNH